MKWPFSFKKKPTSDNQAIIDRYRELRGDGLELNLNLVKQLPKVAVPECGKKLGISKAGTLILNNDDEIAILYDYCLHHYRRGGKNVIERYLENSPPPPDSTEMLILQAMMASYYSLFRVLEILAHPSVNLQDLLTGKTILLVDRGLSDTASPGQIIAGRVLPFAEFNISSGTLIPLPELVYEENIIPVARKFFKTDELGNRPDLSHGQEAAFVAEIIRVSLQAGGADNVFYTDVE